MQERKRLELALGEDRDLEQRVSDLEAFFELAREGEPVEAELRREMKALAERAATMETAMLLGGENDRRNAIVTLHPGAGGVESMDWAQMLLRMYLRWAEREGFAVTITDTQPGDRKSVV